MLKRLLKKIIYGKKYSSESYILYLKKIGVKIGRDCTIYSPKNTIIDEQYPWLISIGNHVRITEGVILLTHDYSWSVLKRFNEEERGVILGAAGSINIGNNVFIGMNTVVLRNVTIGDNVIIGAGSIVSKNCESNWVYAGNPAKKIMTVKEFYNRRKEMQLEEAKKLAISYKERYGKIPPKEVFHEFFMLFTTVDKLEKPFVDKMKLCENFEDSMEYMKNFVPIFSNYEEFIRYCLDE
ncbi:TPA: acyltransferase [Clostridium perfringens]|nr:acyltransferase [Clostridium perfringens]HAT4091524.1 acyltransferase [Clostridium perfringens]